MRHLWHNTSLGVIPKALCHKRALTRFSGQKTPKQLFKCDLKWAIKSSVAEGQ